MQDMRSSTVVCARGDNNDMTWVGIECKCSWLQIMLEVPGKELQLRAKREVIDEQAAVQKAPGDASASAALAQVQQRQTTLDQRLQAYKALRQMDVDDVKFKVLDLAT